MTPGRDRSRIAGNVLLALGVAGMILFGLLGAALVTALPTFTATTDPAASLRDARKLATDSAAALRQADASLATSAGATADAAATLSSLATTMRQGSTALQLEVLGQRPFSKIADLFTATADRADATAQSVASTSASIASIHASIQAMIADLESLAAELGSLSTGPVSWLNPIVWLGMLAGLVWSFVVAALMTWAGWLLRRGDLVLPPRA